MANKKTVVTAKCVCCGTKREIQPGEIPDSELPMCPKCYSPMIVDSAKQRKK